MRFGQVLKSSLFFSGNLSLPKLFPFFGATQMQVITVLTSILVLLANSFTVLSVQERVLLGRSKLVILRGLGGISLNWMFVSGGPKMFGEALLIP